MSRRIRSLINAHRTLSFAALLLVGLAVALVGCDADSPSEPDQPPGTPPGGGPSNASYNISVSIDPPQVPAGSTDPVTVTVRVTRRDTGQAPANGTTLVVAAAAGSFGAPGAGTSIVAELINGQATVPYFPPETQGTGQVTIQARLEDSVGQAVLRIAAPSTFFIASVQPNTGSPNGGEAVTITGGGFESPVRVTFDGVPAQVQSVSANRIRVITPPSAQNVPVGGTAAVSVSVTINLNEADQQVDTLPSAFIYARGGNVIQPQVFSVSPASGPNDGGTRVTIVGEGFQAPVQVFFGSGSPGAFTGLEATVESVTPTRLVIVTPPAQGFGQNNLNEVVDILIRNLNSGFATVATSAFQYGSGGANVPFISAVSPNQGPFTGGTLATLFGQGFDEPVSVTLAGVAATVISVTATEVVVRSSGVAVSDCGDVTGAIELVNIETGESATGPDWIYRVRSPVITGVAPSSGPQAGNTQVTVSGIDFQEPIAVRLARGGESFSAGIQTSSPTSIVIRTPAVPNNTLAVDTSCDDNADGTTGERYIPTAFDVVVENLVTGCTDTFEGAFTYTPSDASCRGDVGEVEPPPVQCEDGFDNDGDGLIDAADPECTGPGDDDESS